MNLPAGSPPLGTLLAEKYLLDGVLGVGGMGVVYRARHTLLNVPVAVKTILPEFAARPEFVARFTNEARAAARIQSDHIARVSDVGTSTAGIPYIVMDLLEGEDLGSVLAREGPQPLGRSLDWILQTIAGLADAHAAGIVHRDLKPSNLFLARRGGKSPRIKICDFGISKTAFEDGSGQITKTNSTLGSPSYMAPEQLRSARNVDHRADVWSLGILLYELLTGSTPFSGDNVGAVFAAILEDAPPPLRALVPWVPEEVERAVLRCLQKKPGDRWAHVNELADALTPFAEGGAAESSRRRSLQPPGMNVAFQPTTPVHDTGPRAPAAEASPAHGMTSQHAAVSISSFDVREPRVGRGLVFGAVAAIALAGLLVSARRFTGAANAAASNTSVSVEASSVPVAATVLADAGVPNVTLAPPAAVTHSAAPEPRPSRRRASGPPAVAPPISATAPAPPPPSPAPSASPPAIYTDPWKN